MDFSNSGELETGFEIARAAFGICGTNKKTAIGVDLDRSLWLISAESLDRIVVVEIRNSPNDESDIFETSFTTGVLTFA